MIDTLQTEELDVCGALMLTTVENKESLERNCVAKKLLLVCHNKSRIGYCTSYFYHCTN